MKIFVTGGTGFIGKHLIRRLSNTDHEIRCFVRKTSNLKPIQHFGKNIEFIKGDITDRQSVKNALKGMDAVIHLANIYDFWIKRKKDFYDVNVQGTQNLMEEALTAKIKKVIHVSSLVVFGSMKGEDFNEDAAFDLYHGLSLYAKTKYEGEKIAWRLYENKGLPLVVVYPGGVTGPGDDKTSGRYINNLVNRKMPAQVFTDSVLSWVDVRDVAEIIVRALEKNNNIGEKYFASAERLTFREFNQLIAEKAAVKIPSISLPTPLVMINAKLLTFFSNIFKVPPMLGMSMDQMRTMSKGFSGNGKKAVRELGITYRPVETSVADMVNSLTKKNTVYKKDTTFIKETN